MQWCNVKDINIIRILPILGMSEKKDSLAKTDNFRWGIPRKFQQIIRGTKKDFCEKIGDKKGLTSVDRIIASLHIFISQQTRHSAAHLRIFFNAAWLTNRHSLGSSPPWSNWANRCARIASAKSASARAISVQSSANRSGHSPTHSWHLSFGDRGQSRWTSLCQMPGKWHFGGEALKGNGIHICGNQIGCWRHQVECEQQDCRVQGDFVGLKGWI